MTNTKYYVNMDTVVAHVQLKLDTDAAALQKIMDGNDGRHDFEEQVRLLQEIQASVRAIDIMLGRCAVDGQIYDSSEYTVTRVTDDLQATWGTPEFQGTPPVISSLPETLNSVEQALTDQSPGRTTDIPTFLTNRKSLSETE